MKNSLNVEQIKKLWILDLIVRSGSLKGAAALAKVSPSAVSQTLTALEKSVGKPLIIREKGSITPTPEAISILSTIRPAFEAFDKLNELGAQSVPKISLLNFGTYESIAVDILPGLMNSLKSKLPNLRLGLRIARTGQLLTMVRKGELCSAIVAEVDDLDKFYKVEVFKDRLGVYVSSKSELAGLGSKAIEKLGYGALAAGKGGPPRYYSKFMKRMPNIKPAVLSESFETLRVAAASGVIAAVLPNRVATRFDDLIEITPEGSMALNGEHKIYVVSQPSCDREETGFLANEVSKILSRL